MTPLRADPPQDGLASYSLLASAEAPSAFPLTAGQALVQEIPQDLASIGELTMAFEPTATEPAAQAPTILLTTAEGEILHREIADEKRLQSGSVYSLHLRAELPLLRFARPLYLFVFCAPGEASSLRPLIAPTGRIGRLRALAAADLQESFSQAAEGSGTVLTGSLVLSVTARSILGLPHYHRGEPQPAAERLARQQIERICLLGTLPPELAAPDGSVIHIAPSGPSVQLPDDADALLIVSPVDPEQARSAVAAAQSRYLPVLRLGGDSVQLAAWADGVLRVGHGAENGGADADRVLSIPRLHPDAIRAAIAAFLPAYRRKVLPKFSIVTILYQKAAQIDPVLESYFRQDYPGGLEVIFVDDCSPDDGVERVERAFQRAKERGSDEKLPTYRILRQPRNQGNCHARNLGIAAATGDVVIVIDADCMLSRDFVRRHAEAHSFADCEVVIGPIALYERGTDPLVCLQEVEENPSRVFSRLRRQDPVNIHSFVNCVTRNLSFRPATVHAAIDQTDPPSSGVPEVFDPAFTYSSDPESGFGWEDVELGYRLYQRGARIKFVSEALAVHIEHPPLVARKDKPARSLKNFRRLLEKHPAIVEEAARWAVYTFERIRAWFRREGEPESADVAEVESLLRHRHGRVVTTSYPSMSRTKRLRILSYRWHVPHQYELYKLGHEIVLLRQLGRIWVRPWDLGKRPLPSNVKLRTLDTVDPAGFDLALLHFDENVLFPEETNGVLNERWGYPFRFFMERLKIPKIAICHGTPQFYGQYDPGYDEPDLMQVNEPSRQALVDYLGDTLVVCNSHQAQREWGFRRSRVIWHGFDPAEFPPSRYERGVLMTQGRAVEQRPHYRGRFFADQVLAGDAATAIAPEGLLVPDPSPLYQGAAYAHMKFRSYVDSLRSYSSYFNPTLRSPMPRTRGEAMMCGLVTVNADNHDVDRFIVHGVNGFRSTDPAELRENLLYLVNNRRAARAMGAESRKTALALFNHARYLSEWDELLRSELGSA